jgi:hypothetical protein
LGYDIAILQMESYVMPTRTAYINVTSLSILSTIHKAGHDKPYNINALPTAAVNTFCNIMIV